MAAIFQWWCEYCATLERRFDSRRGCVNAIGKPLVCALCGAQTDGKKLFVKVLVERPEEKKSFARKKRI